MFVSATFHGRQKQKRSASLAGLSVVNLIFAAPAVCSSTRMSGHATEGSGDGKTRSNFRGLAPRKSALQDMGLEVWSRSIEGVTTEIGCYGLASVLKVSDDKIDHNRPNFVSFCCFQTL